MAKKRILITGSAGTVGSYTSTLFPEFTLLLTTKNDLDVTKKSMVASVIHKFTPDYVLHLAAKTNVDECEKNPQEAFLTNARGTENIAKACKNVNATLIYLSTSAVFNGKKRFYTEKDSPDPINTYGKTKLQGEDAIQKLLKKYFIVRAGWIIGGGIKEKKFISYMLQQIRDGKKELRVVNDKFGTITYAKELLKFIKDLLPTKNYGVYHFGSSGVCSRFTLAKHLVKLLEKETIQIQPVASALFANSFSAPRPTYEVIRSQHTTFPSSWKKNIQEYITNEIKTI